MARHRWTIRALGDELDLHPSTLQRYRDGSYPVPRVVEIAIAHLEHTT